MLDNLLELCGFDKMDMDNEKRRIERALEIAGLGSEDIERAIERVRKHFDIELLGIRKCLGIWMKEFSDMVLAKEDGKKVAYTIYPSVTQFGLSALFTSEEVYVCAPEVILEVVMGSIFGAINPVLEAAETNGMGPGLAHCGLLQARLGGITKGIVPVPDVTLTTGFFCDQAPKTDELIHEIHGVPNIFIDRCYEPDWDEYPNIEMRDAKYFGAEIDRSMKEFEKIMGLKLTEEAKSAAFKQNGKGWFAYLNIVELMRADPVPLTPSNGILLPFFMVISPMKRFVNEGAEALKILHGEVKEMVKAGKGATPKGAPRVIIMLPSWVDPEFSYLITHELGIAAPVCSLNWLIPREMEKTHLRDFGGRIGEAMLRRGAFHSASGYIAYMKEIAERWKIDGVILNFPFSCRPAATPPMMAKRSLEEDLGIPVLLLEYDIYDSRDYSTQQVRTRVETFAELLKLNKVQEAA
ncbi:MAG: 2-hydroxyacyl-CoA dehydratase family protein [Desulfatiglans sp.]|jgi:hypothetical protein|nr:2-hydroxyacyl-CoA dehydratase family protein [Thermodesulfobacteriota bacterium]MEE4354011.1 2-hydroxyacyl-CoA dehydratase family protein [Desulfatiglans sp.]